MPHGLKLRSPQLELRMLACYLRGDGLTGPQFISSSVTSSPHRTAFCLLSLRLFGWPGPVSVISNLFLWEGLARRKFHTCGAL